MRIAVMFENLGPYHVARLANAAKRCELMALEIRAKSTEYLWDAVERVPFTRRTLFFDRGPDKVGFGSVCKLIEAALGEHRTEVLVVPGWSSSFAIAGVIVAGRLGIPAMVMSESQESDFDRKRLRESVKRRYLRCCRTALVGGAPQQEYLVKLGMSPSVIRTGYDVVDNDYFTFHSDRARRDAAVVRAKHRLPGRFFLASSRFIPKKNLETLIRAFAEYRKREAGQLPIAGGRWDLVIMGDGALRADLEAIVRQLSIEDAVHFPGFKQYQELPDFYGLASVFVHASTSEQWGLVVNEAMASGLPVLVSERCGCARDLVKWGANGFTFDPDDEAVLAKLMSVMAGEHFDLGAMGEESRRIIARWTVDSFGENLVACAQDARRLGTRPMSALDRCLLEVLGRCSERLKADSPGEGHLNRAAPTTGRVVRDFFDSQAESYPQNFLDMKRGGNYRFFRRLQIAAAYASPIGGRLLDCAIGSGEITGAVLRAGRFAKADLVDISRNMLAKGREHLQTLHLDVACNYIEDDIFRFARTAHSMGSKYDVILCLGLIAHVGRLEELLRLLRPLLVERTGRLLLQSTLTDHLGVRLVRLLTAHRYESSKKYAISYFSHSEITEAATKCGFELLDETRFGLMVPFGDRLWPLANFHAERLAAGFARRRGGEVVYAFATGSPGSAPPAVHDGSK